MKGKDPAGKEHASCCGDSCPMMGKDGGKTADKASCCGDSCPMMGKDDGKSADKAKPSCCDKDETVAAPKKDGEAAKAPPVDMKNVVVAASTEGCSCSCCSAKKDK
jgi:hypothetical protein